MRRWSRYLVLGTALLSTTALAADDPQTTVVVQGKPFVVFVKQGVALTVPAVAQTELARDPFFLPPDCETMNIVLAPSRNRIEQCKQPSQANTPACVQLRNTINNMVRFAPGDTTTNLLQEWAIESTPPVGGPTAAQIRTAVAQAVGMSQEAVYYQHALRPRTPSQPAQISIAIAASGTSWASKLSGFVDVAIGQNGAPAVTWDSGAGQFVTRDHVLACGIAAGDVKLSWQQPTVTYVEATLPGPFSASQIWDVYQTLDAGAAPADEDPIRRATQVGARIGVALEKHDLASQAQLSARTQFLVNGFYRGDALEFEADLARDEVESRAVGRADLEFELGMSWTSVSARL
jgi:hypothetical protein